MSSPTRDWRSDPAIITSIAVEDLPLPQSFGSQWPAGTYSVTVTSLNGNGNSFPSTVFVLGQWPNYPASQVIAMSYDGAERDDEWNTTVTFTLPPPFFLAQPSKLTLVVATRGLVLTELSPQSQGYPQNPLYLSFAQNPQLLLRAIPGTPLYSVDGSGQATPLLLFGETASFSYSVTFSQSSTIPSIASGTGSIAITPSFWPAQLFQWPSVITFNATNQEYQNYLWGPQPGPMPWWNPGSYTWIYPDKDRGDYMQGNWSHNGIDIGLPSYRPMYDGTAAVVAAADGILVGYRDGLPSVFDGDRWEEMTDAVFGTSALISSPPAGAPPIDLLPTLDGQTLPQNVTDGSGNVIYLLHRNGFITQYAHLRSGMTLIQQGYQIGDWVPQGTVLGIVGSSGASSGPHLHFGVYASPLFQPNTQNASDPTGLNPSGGYIAFSRFTGSGVWGPGVCPCYPPYPSTQLSGFVVVPQYRNYQSAPGSSIFFDAYVGVAPPWVENPCDNLTQVPSQLDVYYYPYTLGSLSIQIQVSKANSTTPLATFAASTLQSNPGRPLLTTGSPASQPPLSVQPGQYFIQPFWPLGGTISPGQPAGPPLPVTIVDGWQQVSATLTPAGAFGTLTKEVSLTGATTGTATVEAGVVRAGDTQANQKALAILTFDLTGLIPPGSAVSFATLTLTAASVSGRSPFAARTGTVGYGWAGRLYVDMAIPAFGGNDTALNAAMFDAPPTVTQVAQMPGAAPGATCVGVITAAGLSQLTSSTTSVQFRLAFEYPTNMNGQDDWISFFDASSPGDTVASLTLYYASA